MGMAYALKKGELDPKDTSAEVQELADSMTLKQLKDFASTKHDGLPQYVEENIMPANLTGMGPVVLPNNGALGSGDMPAGSGDAEEEYKKKKRKRKLHLTFESFINEAYTDDDINMMYGYFGAIEDEYGEKEAYKRFDQAVKELIKEFGIKEEDALDLLNSKAGRQAAEAIANGESKEGIVNGIYWYLGKDKNKVIKFIKQL